MILTYEDLQRNKVKLEMRARELHEWIKTPEGMDYLVLGKEPKDSALKNDYERLRGQNLDSKR